MRWIFRSLEQAAKQKFLATSSVDSGLPRWHSGKESTCQWDMVRSLGREDPLEKEMATHSSILALRIPGTGEPGGLPFMGSHRVGHDWSDLATAAAKLYCWCVILFVFGASLVAQTVKRLPAMEETSVWFLGQENRLEKEMATHSSILAWRIPWTEEPGGL